MGRDTKAVGKLGKKRRPKGATAKPRSAPKAERGRRSSGANRESKVVRLTRELGEALQRQAATADILKVIAGSPTDTQPVFEAIVLTAVRLLRCDMSFVMFCEPTAFWVAAAATPEGLFDDLTLIREQIDPNANFPSRAIVEKRALHLPDWSLIDLPEHERRVHETVGVNSALYLPLMREGECIGLLTLGGKQANIFGESDIALAESFRDQALIAIENARLFNETREALERQTATADILRVISESPTDVQPVFQAIAEHARLLCKAKVGATTRLEGDMVHLAGVRSMSVDAEDAMRSAFPMALELASPNIRRAIIEQAPVQIPDVHLDSDYAHIVDGTQRMGFRSIMSVPLMHEGRSIGTIGVAREEPGLFPDAAVSLLQTFADQAVIAIENARLFEKVRARTRDLSESLQQQTATAEVLKVIASSTTDVAPVLKAIVDSACELCEAGDATVLLKDGDDLRFSFHHGPIAIGLEKWPLSRKWLAGRSFLDKTPIHVHDLQSAEGDEFPEGRQMARSQGSRTVLCVPLLREGEAIGVIGLRREELKPFTDKQIALLQTFAAQAVIAIENTRLFNETAEALERQTATADILKVIASSPSDLQPVFNAIAERSNRLVDALSTTVFTLADGTMHLRAFTPTTPETDTILQATFPAPLSTFSWGESIGKGEIYRVIDSEHEPEGLRDLARLRGWRSCLCVPLLRDGKPIGMIGPTRAEPGPFTDHQVQLLQTFADQAVIAISNVGLFNEVQERTRELSKSLDDLRAAQDRLVQTEKLASLGQLTAGIAHEIKNPLNFVNNFSALSAELVGEMNDVLAEATLDKKTRGELDELAQMLKSNLEKVVQHGKRADSIVKNMLLHSREGSGEHRPVDINAIVDESLNLAYHGARAEKTGFNIIMQRNFDPATGMADGYPQEITRALLNLISNGFYAATKRKSDAGDGFEPTLTATTKNLGDKVEIRIRDNGTGIPTEVKEKIFNPFFTTKPAGEGTGLGLSMSHDIIVKQHGGTIDVDTAPGAFTEFRIVLPRAGAFLIKSGEQG